MAGPPVKRQLGALMQQVVTRGRLPHATVDFPRWDEAGLPVAKVYLRPLAQYELDLCRANARAYVHRVLGSKDSVSWKPEELEDNATAAEILAVACRNADDPEKPFFEYGVVETRECTTEELAMLFNKYNEIRERSYPTFREMSEAEALEWLKALEADAESFPFYLTSRSKLEAFCVWESKYLVSLARLVDGTTSNTSPASPS
jgi:hypothetical protein